jgi:hypothetical protein
MRVLQIEAPDTCAIVSFIDVCSVRLGRTKDGTLEIEVRATHGPGMSSFDVHDFTVTLPVQTSAEEEE